MQGSNVVDKIKSALPFQTLSVFELAEAEDYQTPPQENQNADLGPNEVTKESIGDISLDANNPFDTAAPGELQHFSSVYWRLVIECSWCILKHKYSAQH